MASTVVGFQTFRGRPDKSDLGKKIDFSELNDGLLF